MIRVKHRGYTASLIGAKMTIRNWNGDVVAMDKWWKYAYAGDTEERLKQAIDDMIRLAPFLGASWWREDGLYRARETR